MFATRHMRQMCPGNAYLPNVTWWVNPDTLFICKEATRNNCKKVEPPHRVRRKWANKYCHTISQRAKQCLLHTLKLIRAILLISTNARNVWSFTLHKPYAVTKSNPTISTSSPVRRHRMKCPSSHPSCTANIKSGVSHFLLVKISFLIQLPQAMFTFPYKSFSLPPASPKYNSSTMLVALI